MGFRAPMHYDDAPRHKPRRTLTDYAAGALLGFSIGVLAIVGLLVLAAAVWTVTP